MYVHVHKCMHTYKDVLEPKLGHVLTIQTGHQETNFSVDLH